MPILDVIFQQYFSNFIKKQKELNPTFGKAFNEFLDFYVILYFAYRYLNEDNDLSTTIEYYCQNNDIPSSVREYVDLNKDKFYSCTLQGFESFSSFKVGELLLKFKNYNKHKDDLSSRVSASVFTLVNKLLSIQSDDSICNFSEGIKNYSITTLKKYKKNQYETYTYNSSVEFMVISAILADIQNIDIDIQLIDFPSLPSSIYSKIYCELDFIFTLISYSTQFSICDYIKHLLNLLLPNGKLILHVPAVLSVNSKYKNLHKFLIDENKIESIISLGGRLVQETEIQTQLLVISNDNHGSVHFIDGIKTFSSDISMSNSRGKVDYLSDENITALYNAYISDTDISRSTSRDTIISKDYDLRVSSYFNYNRLKYKGITTYRSLGELCSIIRGYSQPVSSSSINKTTNNDLVNNSEFVILTVDNTVSINDDKLSSHEYYRLTLSGLTDYSIKDELPLMQGYLPAYDKALIREGDILIPALSSAANKIIVVKNIGSKRIVATSNLYIIRPDQDKVSPYFIKLLLEDSIYEYAAGVSLSKLISPSVLREIEIPDFPIKKQQEIEFLCKQLLFFQQDLKDTFDSIQAELKSSLDNLSQNFYKDCIENIAITSLSSLNRIRQDYVSSLDNSVDDIYSAIKNYYDI